MPENKVKTLAYRHGFDRGNYAAAYETEDFARVLLPEDAKNLAPLDALAYSEGLKLGFFSSFELNEIPRAYRDEIAQLRDLYGENDDN